MLNCETKEELDAMLDLIRAEVNVKEVEIEFIGPDGKTYTYTRKDTCST